LAVAVLFQPWQVLRHRSLQNPWLVAMLVLPWAWWSKHLLPSGLALHLSGACLMVLMFGWPLAIVSLIGIGVGAAVIELARSSQLHAIDVEQAGAMLTSQMDGIVSQIVWMGVLPATLALGLGLAVRRWLPHHLFVYILGRGFFATALAVSISGALGLLAGQLPPSLPAQDWVLGQWLLGWGEAISTGMLTAVFVAFKPQWLLTYSHERYLAPPNL
jgi:uncharacterized membrane protein